MRDVLGTFFYGFHVIIHPFDGFWVLKHHRRKSWQAATIILLLVLIATFVRMQMSGFLFMGNDPEQRNVLMGFVSTLVPLAMWVVVNWSVTTLFDGKGKMKEIYIFSCYALLPMALINLPMALISHFLSIDEAVFMSVAMMATDAWCLWLMLSGGAVVHDYTMFKSVITAVCTVLGIAAAAFLILVIYSSLSQLVNFFVTIGMEIKYW